MVLDLSKHSVGDGLSHSDRAFIKSYYKQKKYLEGEQVLVGNNFDCNARQAPKKTFNKVGRKDFVSKKQHNKIKDFYGYDKGINTDKVNDLWLLVDDMNENTPDLS